MRPGGQLEQLAQPTDVMAAQAGQLDHLDDIGPPPASKMRKESSREAGEAGLASTSHRWPTQSKLAKMSRAMSPYTSYGSIRVTMKLEVHILARFVCSFFLAFAPDDPLSVSLC